MKNKIHNKVLGWGIGFVSVLIATIIIVITSHSLNRNRIITIGIAQWVSNPQYDRNIEGFKTGLAGHGYVEGKNIRFIIENPETNGEAQRKIIESFIKTKVDLIYSLTTPGTLIVKKLTEKIPIVFSIVTYPVETHVINSLKKSGNNLVGTRNYVLPSKQYFTFERLYPNTKTLAFVHRKGEPNSCFQYNEFKDLLENRDIKVLDIASVDLDDMRAQLEAKIDSIDAMYSACDTLIQGGGEEVVIQLSKQYKKPSFTCNKDGVLKGALIGNVADFYMIGKISGEKAALILQGTKPTWLLTESPRQDYVIVNLNTAKELGISIPKDILNTAEEIIEK